MSKPSDQEEPFSPRQQEVLDAALRLLVRDSGGLTMTAVATHANCSKETLYKWFDDRAGLLNAMVRWQASKVRVEALDDRRLDMAALRERLCAFAADWLRVVSSETSLALNRLAIGQAGSGGGKLGAIVLDNGRFALSGRLRPVLEAGRDAGLIRFDDAEEAFRTFFGLVARDVQIRLLLGDDLALGDASVAAEAERATQQFLSLHGAATGTIPTTQAN